MPTEVGAFKLEIAQFQVKCKYHGNTSCPWLLYSQLIASYILLMFYSHIFLLSFKLYFFSHVLLLMTYYGETKQSTQRGCGKERS